MTPTSDLALDRPHLVLPLLVSLLLHMLFVALTLRVHPTEVAPAPIDVEVLTPQEAARREAARKPPSAPAPPAAEVPQESPAARPPQNQIVSPPDSPEALPDHARLLSDRNSRTDLETLKRGEPAAPAKPPQEQQRRAERTQAETREQKEAAKAGSGERASQGATAGRDAGARSKTEQLPGLDGLFVKPSELLAKDPSLARGTDGDGRPAKAAAERNERLASLSRPELWADPGERGLPDYLPDVRNGEFTLLNTKADRFAPFVRRVALRVFQTFSMDLKQLLYAGSVPQGRETIEVEAVMSRDGKKLEVVLKNRDGNLSTDRVLLATLRDQIFFDDNPPPNAVAEDGRIHFLFALNTSVWYGRDDRGQPQPGAHWLFQAGLL